MRRASISLAALALLATACLADQWTDTNVEELIENAPTKEDYPEASAVFMKLQESADVAEDGFVTIARNRLIKVLTLRGRERYSNQQFLYNTDDTEISVLKGVTVRKTGRVVEVEADAINDVTPAFLRDATMYANVMEKVISFPVAGPGSTMELQLSEAHRPTPDGSYSGIEHMGALDPLLEASFTIRYPEGAEAPLTEGRTGGLGNTTLRKSEEPGEIVWSVADVPALVEEEHMPSYSSLHPTVIYSSYRTWDEPAAFFAGQFFPHVQTDGAIAARVVELGSDLSPAEKRKAVFLEVATDIRNVHLNLGLGGYEPNDASEVLENKYGDTRDKAVLLVSMLRAAGIEAYPAVVAGLPDAPFTEDVPTLKQFTRILVAVPDGDSYRYLDPFLDDVSYGFLRWGRGNTALVVRDDGTGELVEIPGFRAQESRSTQNLTVTLDEKGNADVIADCNLIGFFDRKARRDLKDATPSEAEKLFDSAANLVSTGATDEGYEYSDLTDLTAPVRVSQTVRAEELAVPQGDMMIVHLPPYPHGFAQSGIYPSLAERRYAFEFPCEFESVLTINLSLPDGYEVAWLPDDVTLTTPDVAFEIACDLDEENHAVVWRRSVTVNERSIPVERYDEFKDSYDTLGSPKNRLVLLRKS
jgi:hypothetical protein